MPRPLTPTLSPYTEQLPDVNNPATWATRTPLFWIWVTGPGYDNFADLLSYSESAIDFIDAALAGSETVVDAVAAIQAAYILRDAPVFFTTSGTYTPDADVKAVIIEAQGAGGAGPGISLTANNTQVASGGNAGNYVKAFWATAAAATIVIGAAGQAGAATATPTDGGDTSVAATGVSIIARGGKAGTRSGGSTNFVAVERVLNSAPTVSGVDEIFSHSGMPGELGSGSGTNISSTVFVQSGNGGSSPLGSGGSGRGYSGTGNIGRSGEDATGYGAGGGGGMANRTANNQSANGGNGTGGIVIIWEFV